LKPENHDLSPAAKDNQPATQLMIPQIIFEPEKKDAASGDPTAILREYGNLLYRRRWIILAVVVIFAALGVFQIKRSTPYYVTSAIVRYQSDPNKDAMVFDQTRGAATTQRAEDLNTLIRLIESPALASAINDQIGNELRADRTAEGTSEVTPVGQLLKSIFAVRDSFVRSLLRAEPVDTKDPENINKARVNNILRTISASRIRDTSLIQIEVRHPNRKSAARIANEAVDQLISIVAAQKREGLEYAGLYLRQELEEARLNLTKAEDDLRKLSGNSDNMVLAESRQIAIDTLVGLAKERDAQKLAVKMLEAEYSEQSDSTRHFFLASNDRSYQELIQKRNEVFLEGLQGGYVPGSTLRNAVDASLAAIDQLMSEARENLRVARLSELEVARLKLGALETRHTEQQKVVEGIESRMSEFRVAEREVQSAQGIYSTLLDRLKQIQLMQNLDATSILRFKDAEVPTFPAEPNVSVVLTLFILFGFALATGSIVLAHLLDRTVKNPAALESRFALPTLAVIPKIAVGSAKRVGVLPRNAQSVEAEQFRSLRGSLLYAQAGRAPQVILVTSCLPSEGKSTVSTNIAAIFAERGDKTIILDTDLKRSMLHQTFGIARVPGLSDVLTGQKTLEEVTVATEHPGLYVIPAGASTPAPTTLLESEAMGALLDELRKQYSTIIIDSPPSLGLSDPYVLTRRVDGIAIVVRHGKTPMEGLNRVLGKMRSMDAQLLGFVYNFMNMREQGSYAYEYGYGYGYHKKGKEAQNPTEEQKA